ncbi:MAG: cupin domain-containing protein [Opitutae bacterium]|nr:cupin domain-containing protein [Opitutae bacterium]
MPAAARQLIARFRMEPIPHEGAWFAPTYRSSERVTVAGPALEPGARSASSAIYCVQTRADFSALHRLATDELWHFYDGCPLELLLLHPDGRGETVVLGRDVAAGEHPQFLVPHGVWQAARPLGGDEAWTFLGTTLAPGFEAADFAIGYRDELQARYPALAAKIAEFTRPPHLHRPPTL